MFLVYIAPFRPVGSLHLDLGPPCGVFDLLDGLFHLVDALQMSYFNDVLHCSSCIRLVHAVLSVYIVNSLSGRQR